MMLDFRRRSAAANYLAPRPQRRLLFWALGIGLPIIAVLRIADLAGSPARPPSAEAAIDPRLPDRGSQEDIGGVFTSHGVVENAEADTTGRYFAGVKPAYLETVRDDTPSRGADRDACLNLLEVLRQASDDQLKAASQGRASYVQLFRQPDVYRGRLVDLAGTVRRAVSLPLPANDLHLTHYYQLWIQPDGVNNPIVVYALQLPEGFPTGERLREPVELTGFFFKRVAYLAAGGPMTAPMLLARTVQWTDRASAEAAAQSNPIALGWIIAGSLLGLLALVAVTTIVTRSVRPTAARPIELQHSTVETLRATPQIRVEDHLAQLKHDL